MKHAVAYIRFLILNEIFTQDINKEVQSRCFLTFRYLSLLLTVNVWGPAATAGLQCIAVEGNSKLLISGQELEVVSAPVCSPPSLVPWNSCVNSLLFANGFINICWKLCRLPPKKTRDGESKLLLLQSAGSHRWASRVTSSCHRHTPSWWSLCWVSSIFCYTI